MKKIGAAIVALLMAAGLLLGPSATPASAHQANEHFETGFIEFNTSSGTVKCNYYVGGTFGTSALNGHYHARAYTGVFLQNGNLVSHCARNGVSVTGTGSGQYHVRVAHNVSPGPAKNWFIHNLTTEYNYEPPMGLHVASDLEWAVTVCEVNSCLWPISKIIPYVAANW